MNWKDFDVYTFLMIQFVMGLVIVCFNGWCFAQRVGDAAAITSTHSAHSHTATSARTTTTTAAAIFQMHCRIDFGINTLIINCNEINLVYLFSVHTGLN
jgi:hypothetical protein